MHEQEENGDTQSIPREKKEGEANTCFNDAEQVSETQANLSVLPLNWIQEGQIKRTLVPEVEAQHLIYLGETKTRTPRNSQAQNKRHLLANRFVFVLKNR